MSRAGECEYIFVTEAGDTYTAHCKCGWTDPHCNDLDEANRMALEHIAEVHR